MYPVMQSMLEEWLFHPVSILSVLRNEVKEKKDARFVRQMLFMNPVE